MTSFLEKILPWGVVAVLAGVVAGFAFGEAGEADADPAPVEAVGDPSTTTDPAQSATTATQPAPALVCAGGPLGGAAPTAIAGVEGVGADLLAESAGLPSETVAFPELNDATKRQAFTAQVAELAEQGPLVLVAQLSPGDIQKELARELVADSPESVVVVVDKGATTAVDGSALDDFPSRSVVVAPNVPPADGPTPEWATAVLALVNGSVSCPGG